MVGVSTRTRLDWGVRTRTRLDEGWVQGPDWLGGECKDQTGCGVPGEYKDQTGLGVPWVYKDQTSSGVPGEYKDQTGWGVSKRTGLDRGWVQGPAWFGGARQIRGPDWMEGEDKDQTGCGGWGGEYKDQTGLVGGGGYKDQTGWGVSTRTRLVVGGVQRPDWLGGGTRTRLVGGYLVSTRTRLVGGVSTRTSLIGGWIQGPDWLVVWVQEPDWLLLPNQMAMSSRSATAPSNTDLPLSQWDGLDPVAGVAVVRSELEQRRHGVGTRRQHKDQRSTAVGICKWARQVKCRRLDVGLAQAVHDVLLHSWNYLVWAEGTQNHHAVQATQGIVGVGKCVVLRRSGVVEAFPQGNVFLHVWNVTQAKCHYQFSVLSNIWKGCEWTEIWRDERTHDYHGTCGRKCT